ncbi:MAG TPA: hypothetical protein PLT66_00495 [Bacillota bacterium]|nr:hypothetical protein [Bacillota bacterium]
MKRSDKYKLIRYAVICLLCVGYLICCYYGFYLENRVTDSANGVPAILVFLPSCVMLANLAFYAFTKKSDAKKAVLACVAASAVLLLAGDAIAVLRFSTPLGTFRLLEMAVFAIFTINSAIVQTLGLRYLNNQEAFSNSSTPKADS